MLFGSADVRLSENRNVEIDDGWIEREYHHEWEISWQMEKFFTRLVALK